MVVKIVEMILQVYFDGKSDIFNGDEVMIQNREKMDSILSQFVNSMNGKVENGVTPNILSDLWQTRLQNDKAIDSIYSYECLHSVLRIVWLFTKCVMSRQC